jgi:hypothetical protein
VASGTHVSIGTLANEKYFSHCRNQFIGSSPEKVGKSNLGLAIERLKLGLWSLWASRIVWSGRVLLVGLGSVCGGGSVLSGGVVVKANP